MTLTYTRRNIIQLVDSVHAGYQKIFRKMSKFNKYIIPLALIKIALAFLVLQLFFSSCEKDDILYGSDLFTEGPVFEIEAQFGNETTSFETGAEGNGINVGDTLFLEISLESNTHYDQISQTEVTLSDPEYHSQFVFTDAEGNAVFPDYLILSGRIDNVTDEFFVASYGEETPTDLLMSSEGGPFIILKIGFIFNEEGSFTLNFLNTPNNFNADGSVDIYYDRNPEDSKDVKEAYAVYLFDIQQERTQNYNLDGDEHNTVILHNAEFDQAIIDFTVI